MTPEATSPLATRPLEETGALTEPLSASPPARLSVRAGDFARQLSRRRFSLSRLAFIAIVLTPTLATFLYATLWATPQYQSEFRVSVRAAERMQSNALLPSILGLGLSQSGPDSNAVAQYILSHEILDEFSPAIDVRAIYGRSSIDWFNRLPTDATSEAALRYWRRVTEAYYETSTETVVVRVSAFAPDEALALAHRTISLSEALVNRMSVRSREDSVETAKRQVATAQMRLNALREDIKALRDRENLLDPRKEAETDLNVSGKLRGELASTEAELAGMRRAMNDTAPSIIATKNRIAALHSELDHITASTVKQQQTSRPLSSVFGAFEQLESERAFAEKAYQAALSSEQSAELDATRQQLYLATIVKPNLPQEPNYPRPFRLTLLVFMLALAFWGLSSLIVASVRDHR